MRCFIKSYFYYPVCMGKSILMPEPFYRLYQDEDWKFTGRIKYQKNQYGDMKVSFEVNDSKDNQWYESEEFDFDDSTEAVIVVCDVA